MYGIAQWLMGSQDETQEWVDMPGDTLEDVEFYYIQLKVGNC